MKYIPAFGATVLLALGSVQGCSSDENAPAGPTPGSDSSAGGGSGAGGKATGGGAGAGGATTGGAPAGGAGGGAGGFGPDARSPEPTGQACTKPADCFPGIDAGALSGAVECIDKVQDGYCTHRCDTDADCCAVPGECRTNLKQVCSPFENTGYKVCFLSCEDSDIRLPGDAGTTLPDGAPAFVDANAYCQKEANPDFICRSTGGGSQNRKVCVPGGTAGDGGLPGDGGRPRRDGGRPPRPDGGGVPEASTDGSAPSDAAMDGRG